MFAMPFLYGNGWSATEDDGHARVVVITKALNEKLFGGDNSVGQDHAHRQDRLPHHRRARRLAADAEVLRHERQQRLWRERAGVPAVLDLARPEDGPQRQHELLGRFRHDPEGETGVNAPCAWIQYWVQLDTPAKAAAYKQYLVNYSDQQRAAGRFERPTNVRLRGLMEWLDFNKVVPGDVRLQVWLAFGFLLVCLLNTVGLLLAKFLRRSGEIGVRRALGASRKTIFMQCLVEAGAIGLAGGDPWTGAGMAGPVGGAPATDRLRRPGPPGSEHAADDLRAGHRRQPARRPAAGLERDAGDARDAVEVSKWSLLRFLEQRSGASSALPENAMNSAPSFPPCCATRRPPR